MEVVCGMLAKELGTGDMATLAGDLKLEDQLFGLTGTAQEEVFSLVSPIDSFLFPGLVNYDLGSVCDL